MKTLQKFFLSVIVTGVIISSCNNSNKSLSSDKVNSDVNDNKVQAQINDDQIIDVVKEYLKKRDKYVKIEESIDKNGGYSMTYYTTYDSIDFMNNECEGVNFGKKSILIGDFNNDKLDDAVISVVSSSCPMGNAWNQIHLLIMSENNKLKVVSEFKSGGVQEPTYSFYDFENGYFNGEKREYQGDDAACCPSKVTNVRFAVINNQIVEIK